MERVGERVERGAGLFIAPQTGKNHAVAIASRSPKPFIPSSAPELNPTWLTEVLRERSVLPVGTRVSEVAVSELSGGKGMSGDVVRIHLTYSGDQGDAPDTMIAKFPTVDVTNRGLIESQGAYEREINFYRTFIDDIPIRVPAYYGSAMDSGPPRAVTAQINKLLDKLPAKAHVAMTRDVTKFLKPSKRRYALLIEDLGSERRVFDLAGPPTPELLGLALEELAKVHAYFWGDARLKGHAAFWPLVTELPLLQRNVFEREALAQAMDRYGYDEARRAVCNEAGTRYPNDVARINRPLTLVHGDTRSDNLLYSPDAGDAEDGRGVDVAIVDWAIVGYADPGYDVGYMLASSIDPALGADGARQLVEQYHRALSAAHVSYDIEEVWQSVLATARCMVVQQTLSLRYLQGDYGEAGLLADLWLPRAFAVLGV